MVYSKGYCHFQPSNSLNGRDVLQQAHKVQAKQGGSLTECAI